MRLLSTVLVSAVGGRCPACRRGPLFRGLFAIHERCPACGIRYEQEPGAWLGALALGYGLGALAAIAMTAVEFQWGPLRAVGVPPAWGIAVLSLPVTLLAYRPAKGAWFALLHLYGFMPREES